VIVFKYLLIVFIVLTFGGTIFSQSKKISNDEYLTRFLATDKKARDLSWREVSTTSIYKDDKLISTNGYIFETVPAYRNHIVQTETSDGKTTRIEEITIGRDTTYCKRDEASWEIVKHWSCISGGDPILHLDGNSTRPVITSYTVEKTALDGKEVKYYRKYIESMNYEGYRPVANRRQWPSFSEEFYILDDKGLLLRWEMRSGLLNPKRVEKETIKTYIYDPNIKIEAPIK
jgi:hypothetical protein